MPPPPPTRWGQPPSKHGLVLGPTGTGTALSTVHVLGAMGLVYTREHGRELVQTQRVKEFGAPLTEKCKDKAWKQETAPEPQGERGAV